MDATRAAIEEEATAEFVAYHGTSHIGPPNKFFPSCLVLILMARLSVRFSAGFLRPGARRCTRSRLAVPTTVLNAIRDTTRMSSQDCSHVWSELLIAAKAFRRTIRPAFTVQPQNIVQRASKLHRRVSHLGNDPLIGWTSLSIRRIDDDPKVSAALTETDW